MPEVQANGINLYYEVHGDGEPMALVHGSWGDADSWAAVVPGLAESFRVLVYDRRGHSRSQRAESAGSVDEDGDDLGALLETLDLGPAHVVTNSYGGNLALRLATRRPELFRSLSCHEPPLWGILRDDAEVREPLQQQARKLEAVGALIAQGDHEGAARLFVEEVAFGPGAWENELPPDVRNVFVQNAPTFLDELQDPNQFNIEPQELARLECPIRLTQGSESPPTFTRVVDRLAESIPHLNRETIEGAGHVPHLTHPKRFAEVTAGALQRAAD